MTHRSARRPRHRQLTALAVTALLSGGAALHAGEVASGATATPTTVSVPGTIDSRIGCSGDWQTECAQAQLTRRSDGKWSRTFTLPAGSYAYKVAINGSWAENYGANAAPGGANIALSVPAGGRAVTFVYDPVTHWMTDDVGAPIVTAAGDFQSELGCPGDWAPDCLRTLLEDADGDGQFTFTTTAIPAGSWMVKAALGQSWSLNYGQNGAAGGANIGFAVTTAGSAVTFSYSNATHVLAVTTAAGPSPSPSTSSSPPATPVADTLGALWTPTSTTFRLWSPDSSNVGVSVSGRTVGMTPVALAGYTNVYQAAVPGDLKNSAYQFFVNGSAVRDPYAQMVNPGTKQGIVIDQASIAPSSGSWAPRPALAQREDSVVYELDVRDYTIDASSGVDPAKRGKFLGMVQTGTSYNGVRTGIDHLKDLGVTAVQLMPSFDFNSTVPNWGYDPVNYNVPEEQFATSNAPDARVREFKDMVDAFHRNGIRVIMDVVYNHTASKDVFGPITNAYYNGTDLSGTGNSLDDGNPMVSRMIQDSLTHWVRDYNIDGFRFDLLGVHRYANVATWGTALNAAFPDRNLLIYGEPWSGGVSDPSEMQKVRYGSVPALAGAHVGVFNGNFRDAIRGGTNTSAMAYMGGNGNASDIALGLRGSLLASKSTSTLSNPWSSAFTYDPEQTVNYASVHDDLGLADKITYSGGTGGANGRTGQIDRFAAGLVMTAQGIAFMSEGDEFLRSKVLNGNYNTAMNSYNAGDDVNAIHWGDLVTNASVNAYYKAAIALRRSTPALRLTTWDAVNSQEWVRIDGSVVIASISSSAGAPTAYDTIVVANPTASVYAVNLPAGVWTKVLASSGAVRSGGNDCGPLAVTVFRRL